jgi:hypothetical protein
VSTIDIVLTKPELGIAVRAMRTQLLLMADHVDQIRKASPQMAMRVSGELIPVRELANKMQWGPEALQAPHPHTICRICDEARGEHHGQNSDNCRNFV